MSLHSSIGELSYVQGSLSEIVKRYWVIIFPHTRMNYCTQGQQPCTIYNARARIFYSLPHFYEQYTRSLFKDQDNSMFNVATVEEAARF